MSEKEKEQKPQETGSEEDALHQRLEALKAKIEAKEAELIKLKAKNAGWLILCKNAVYEGSAYGIKFSDGMAFIPKDKVVAYFNQEQNESPEKNRSAAEIAVNTLVNDFGYTAQFYTEAQTEDLQQAIDRRQKEASAIRKDSAEKGNIADRLIAH